jgi:transposase InsO family protein
MIDGIDFANSFQHPSPPSLIFITTYVNNKQMKILIDTGAQHSFINEKCLKSIDQFKYSNIQHQKFFLADGLTSFIVTGTVHLNIHIGDVLTNISAFITKNLCTTLILGMDYLLKYDLDIQPKKKSILFNFHDQKIMIPIDTETTPIDFPVKLSKSTKLTPDSDHHYFPDHDIPIIPHLSNPSFQSLNTITPPPSSNTIQQAISNLLHHISDQDQHDRIQLLLFRFESSFDTSKYTVTHTQLSHVIETYPHTPPVTKCYPSNPTSISEMRLIINKLLEAGLVRQSQSSYAAPALLIKKKDETWRLVIDYKKLNAITIKDNYPLPNMEVTLQTLGAGYSYFTKLDLKSGFWQLPIDEKDRYKTAFTTPFGLFEWLVLPQGLRNAPPSFQRIMNNILGSYSEFCLVYLDDIVIFSHDFNQHLFHLEQILNALRSHNLILTSTKCEIAKQKIEYLGHMISSTTISPLPEKIKSIILLPEPKSLAQANRFIGGLSWYRKFIPNFASVAAPIHAITNLSKSNRYKFKWGYEQSKSFNDLKQLLTSTPLFLNFPDDTHPVLLSTDASQVGLGGVLYQDINNVRRILYYHSELLSSSQKRFHPIELEALAIFKCITRMKSFLLGRNIIIYTDNCPLCHMMEKKIANKRVEKISLLLQEFDIQQIIHVKGQYNCLPDYLSRHPISSDDELLDSDYGLGFTKDKFSSVQLLGAVVTRSKSKAMSHYVTPPPSTIQQQPSLKSSSSSSNDLHHHQHIREHFDITTLKEHQQNDSRIQKIINDLKQHPNISFEYEDGILYKLLCNRNAPIKRKLIYVPHSMINSLLFSYHDNPLIGGHFAVQRTLEKLKQKFWWPDMKQNIINYIKSCVVCQAYNVSRHKRPGFLCPITYPDGPNQLIGMDFCGPFPITPQDNRYVLCLTDYFTKFITAIALPVCSASVTATAIFKEYICLYGVPQAIISDQGTSFKNQLMNSLSQLLGYHHIFSTPYHPQSNGQIERFNGTFVTQLAKLTDRETNNWDEYLYPIVFAYNTGIHSTTNITPFELTFGRKANLPTDHPPTTFTFPQPNDYFVQLARNLKHYHIAVKQNILNQQQQTKIRYDHRRSNPQYDLGTTVLTRIFTNRSKLDPKFSVIPKIVVNKKHPIYYVEDMNTKTISRVHVNDLRPLLLHSNT